MLRDDGVRLGAIVHTDDPTTLAVAEIDPSKSARYRFYDQGTSAPGLTAEAALAALPPAVATLHLGPLAPALEPIASAPGAGGGGGPPSARRPRRAHNPPAA